MPNRTNASADADSAAKAPKRARAGRKMVGHSERLAQFAMTGVYMCIVVTHLLQLASPTPIVNDIVSAVAIVFALAAVIALFAGRREGERACVLGLAMALCANIFVLMLQGYEASRLVVRTEVLFACVYRYASIGWRLP